MYAPWWHRLQTLTLLLIAGLIISVVAAFAIDPASDLKVQISVGAVEAHGRTWVLTRHRSWAVDMVYLDTYGPQRPSAAEEIVRFHQSLSGVDKPAELPWWMSIPDAAPPPGQDTQFEVANVGRGARGFPLPCLYRGRDWVRFADGTSSFRIISDLPFRQGPLAVALIPVGLAVNAAFYGAIVGMVCLLPGVVRRLRRCARGLCPRCGYARTGLPSATPCPECGQPAK